MRVTVTRGGGLAGLVRVVSVDAEHLSPGDAESLARLVDEAGLLDPPGSGGTNDPQPDRFDYSVTVEDKGETRRSAFLEQGIPAPVHDLISWIGRVPGHTKSIEPPGLSS